ncbi:MAG: hypothetical protein QXX23_07705 [Thermoplasmata archaeon]
MIEPLRELFKHFKEESEKIREELARESEEVKVLMKTDDEKIKEKITELYNTIVKQDALQPGLNKLYDTIIDYAKQLDDEKASFILNAFHDKIYITKADIQETLKEMYNIVNGKRKKKDSKNELLMLAINLFKHYTAMKSLTLILCDIKGLRESEACRVNMESNNKLKENIQYLLDLLLHKS